ncbi:hypothetical protein [Nocardioides antri]|uniref:Uncharacterized protein n=1 Tax=Nocardioides antri TaxID=2607659 RepID=A0A5B1M554_9ACTN|nr:hypothetical protein [Nocardioides antri]KAA1427864.1 hypothetical protein F0U47_10615 [Nocardioides antri]
MTEPTTYVEPGEQLPDETGKAYAAFRAYLEAGPGRSVVKVAAECNKSASLLHRWSSRHRWQARVEAWDAAMRRTYDEELREARRESARRHLRVAREALRKVEERLNGLDAADLSPSDLTRLWDVAAKIERDVLGEPHRVTISGPEGGPIPVTDVATLDDEARRDRLAALRREIDTRLEEARAAAEPLSPPTTTGAAHTHREDTWPCR